MVFFIYLDVGVFKIFSIIKPAESLAIRVSILLKVVCSQMVISLCMQFLLMGGSDWNGKWEKKNQR